MSRFVLGMFVAGSLWSACGYVIAAEVDESPTITGEVEENWEYRPATAPSAVYKPNPQAIFQQKAMVRAQQRQDRLASMSWYGMSNSRPIAAPTPFTSMYSPAWQGAGARPFAWHTTGRPTYVFR